MKVTVPTSLSEITLSQYLRYLDMLKEADKKPNTDEFIEVSILQIFCNLRYEDVMRIEVSFVSDICQRIKDILVSEPALVERFKVGNLTFGWLPKLDDMSYGEFLDLNSNISEWDNMVIAMGVLYRPIVKEFNGKYLVEQYKGDTYHEALKEMPMDAVVGAMVFFWNLGLDCTTYIMKHLETEMTGTDFREQLTIVESGLGIQQSMNYVGATLQSLKR